MKRKTKKTATTPTNDGRRFEPVLPDHDRVQCDLTTRTYRADLTSIDEKNRSIEAVIATEDRVRVIDWKRYEVIEEILRMDGLTLPAGDQVPLLDTHNRFSVQSQLGSTRQFRVDGDKLIARNFYSSSKDAEHAWTLCREGHLTDNSVGYRVGDNAVMIEPGKTGEVAGKTYTASPTMALRVVLSWEVRENSVCPIGADPKAKTRQDNSPAKGQEFNRKEPPMNEFKKWLSARGLDYDKLEEAQRAALQKDFDAEVQRAEEATKAAGTPDGGQRNAPVNPPPASMTAQEAKRIADDAVRAELKRQADIRTEAAGLGIEEADIQRCLQDPEMTVEKARGEFLGVIRKRGANALTQAPAGIVVDRSVSAERLMDAMLMRAGMEQVVLKLPDGEKRAAQADMHRDMSMLDLCRHAILLEGKTPSGSRDDMIRTALNTSTLPTVLGAVYNKSLLKGYGSVQDTWSKWCTIGQLSDFKVHTRVRLTGEGEMEKVGDGGELKLGSETEEKATNQLDTYGKKDRYGRQAIINDDLGVLTRVPERRGRDGRLLIGKLVYGALMANGSMQDGTALFHADHKNLNPGKALSHDNIAYAIIQFEKQTDKAGKRISVRPAYLLVPVELKFAARQIVESPLVVYAGTSAANKQVGNKNILEGQLTVIGETLLSDSSLTGYSATSWYLTGDPNEVDTIEVGFLNGRQMPTVHMVPVASDMYIEFESYIDVGVGVADHRGLQKNTA